MNNKNMYKAIAIVSFVISGYFTILLFKSTATTLMESIPMIAIAVIFEVAKWSLLRESILGYHAGWLKVTIFLMWSIITLSSIVASAGYVINQSNKATNVEVENSVNFRNQVNSKDIQKDLYSTKKNQLDNLYKSKDERIKDLTAERERLPKNYITKRIEATAKLKEVEELFNMRIAEVSTELTNITDNINKPIDTTSSVNSTSGYNALFGLSADLYNSNNKDKVSPKNLELWFFLMLGVVLELIANIFAYLHSSNKSEKIYVKPKPENSELKEFPKVQPKNKVVEMPKKETVITGFKMSGVDEKEKKLYLEHMLSTAKKNYSKGYESIGRATGIKIENARAIKNQLEREGIIKTVGSRTVII